jgi:predicted dehydrogenase/threonine dehydrogenase-like Zn-dependent dehydrogenase
VKQVLQSYRTGELWLAEVDPPGPAPGGARVRTRVSLVSAGTERAAIALARKSLVGKARARPDLVQRVIQKARKEGIWSTWEQVWQKLDQPVALGYSCAGVVEDARDAEHLRPGTRVACAGAGYASHSELNWVPRNLIVPLPDKVSFEQGSFATVGAIALQAIRQAEPRLGDRIVVIGLGLLGNLAAQLARASGARVLGIDLAPAKTELALKTGCHQVCADPAAVEDQVAAFTAGHGADTVILAASTPGDSTLMKQAVTLCRLRGRIIVLGDVGMEVPRNEAYLKELDIRLSMSYGPGRYDPAYEERGQDYPYAHVRYTEQRNLAAFLDAVSDGVVDLAPLITHRFSIDRALDAYDLVETGREPHVGILLQYGERESISTIRAVAGAASAAPDVIERVSGRPGVAVIGAGNYLKGVLLPALKRAEVDLVGVVTRTGPSAEQTRSQAGFRWGSTDIGRALSDPKVHALVIGTRHRLHAEQVIAALEAGKHVFVEKPLALSEPELARVAAVQARTGRYVQVGTNRRHSPYTVATREFFGVRGDPLSIMIRVNAGRLDVHHWLRDPVEGGGRLLGEGIHWFDLAHALVGAPISRVIAHPSPGGATALPGDTWTAQLLFRDGSTCTITYDAEGPRTLEKERLELLGVGRAVEIVDWASAKAWTAAGSRALPVPRGQQKGVPEELTAFTESLRTGIPRVPHDVTWHVHHACLQARATLEDGAPREVAWPRPGDQVP